MSLLQIQGLSPESQALGLAPGRSKLEALCSILLTPRAPRTPQARKILTTLNLNPN